jgi:hypothetical protein
MKGVSGCQLTSLIGLLMSEWEKEKSYLFHTPNFKSIKLNHKTSVRQKIFIFAILFVLANEMKV